MRRPSGDYTALFEKAALRGKRTGAASAEWDISGDCQNPRPRELYGQKSYSIFKASAPVTRTGAKRDYSEASGIQVIPARYILLWTRCRRCEKCRDAKRWHWQQRAIREVVNTPGRTWFLTVTLSPEAHLRCQYSLAGWDDWSVEEQERRLLQRELAELTKGLKRLRKNFGPFRYLAATEFHESGLPHFHLLVHESEEGQFTSRTLSGDKGQCPDWWSLGWVHARLADGAAAKRARYVTKYIAKDLSHRVRASLWYGKDPALRLSGRFPPQRGGEGAGENTKRRGKPRL